LHLKHIKFTLLFFLIIPAALACRLASSAEITVNSYLDKSTSGWADKLSDYAFEAKVPGCFIKWNAVEEKNDRRYLVLNRDCPLDFDEQIALHRAILDAIHKRWPISHFSSLSFGSYGLPSEESWIIPIALASAKSAEYRHYRLHYPNTPESLNSLFVKFANQTDAYAPFKRLLSEYGVAIQLSGVEKVFVQKAGKLPFHEALVNNGVRENDKVMFMAGSSYFSVR
jgi:hypothetical protein